MAPDLVLETIFVFFLKGKSIFTSAKTTRHFSDGYMLSMLDFAFVNIVVLFEKRGFNQQFITPRSAQNAHLFWKHDKDGKCGLWFSSKDMSASNVVILWLPFIHCLWISKLIYAYQYFLLLPYASILCAYKCNFIVLSKMVCRKLIFCSNG